MQGPQVLAAAQTASGNDAGQVGQGTTGADTSTPLQFAPVPGLEGVAAADVACGSHHTLVRTREGEVLAFGSNRWCQLGQGSYDDRTIVLTTPAKVRVARPSDARILVSGLGANDSPRAPPHTRGRAHSRRARGTTLKCAGPRAA